MKNKYLLVKQHIPHKQIALGGYVVFIVKNHLQVKFFMNRLDSALRIVHVNQNGNLDF